MTTNRTHWVRIRAHDFERRHVDPTTSGETFTSPFDIPQAVKAEYSADMGAIRVAFRYLDEGEKVRSVVHQPFTVEVGAHSGRIYAILIPRSEIVKAMNARNLDGAVIDSVFSRIQRRDTSDNLDVTRAIVAHNHLKLLGV